MNGVKYPILTEAYIRDQVNTGKSLCQIAREIGCASRTVIRRAKLYNIKSLAKPGPVSKRKIKICKYCHSEISGRSKRINTFCNMKCLNAYRYDEEISKWKQGIWKAKIGRAVRRYMVESAGYECQRCGWGEVNPYSGRIVIEVHHIDGDKTNQAEANLIVLCPNCHSLTKNYRTLNLI